MKTTAIIFLSCCSICLTFAQPGNPLQELIQAEKAFARMAEEKNTRDAFLYFLADDAVTAAPGKGPVSGKQHLESQLPNESLLSWRPLFSDIAISGDFGYNTGPWEFRPNRADIQPVAYGQFVSMWRKDEQGRWQVAIDVGISHGKPSREATTSSLKAAAPGASSGTDRSAIFNIEKEFIQQLHERGIKAYEPKLSSETKFFRKGSEPFAAPDEVKYFLLNAKEKVTFTFTGGDIASSGDLAYVYGKATVEALSKTSHTYMRFWKKKDGEWKIVVDLLSD